MAGIKFPSIAFFTVLPLYCELLFSLPLFFCVFFFCLFFFHCPSFIVNSFFHYHCFSVFFPSFLFSLAFLYWELPHSLSFFLHFLILLSFYCPFLIVIFFSFCFFFLTCFFPHFTLAKLRAIIHRSYLVWLFQNLKKRLHVNCLFVNSFQLRGKK